MIGHLLETLIVSLSHWILLPVRMVLWWPLLIATGFLHFASSHVMIFGLATAALGACAALIAWKYDDGNAPAIDDAF